MSNILIKLLEESDKHSLVYHWDWKFLSRNPNISLEYIESHPDSPYNWNWPYGISYNPNLTLDFILKHKNKRFDWNLISRNPGITLEDIENNPTLPWKWEYVALNPNITIDFILKYLTKFSKRNLNKKLGSTYNITLEHIDAFPNLFWNKFRLSKNPNMTLDYVMQHPVKHKKTNRWQWESVAKSPMITFEDVKKYPKFFKNDHFMRGFSSNPNLTFDNVKDNITLHWDWDDISDNPSFTLEQIESLLKIAHRSDDYCKLLNPNLTYEYIVENNLLHNHQHIISENKFSCHPAFCMNITIRI